MTACPHCGEENPDDARICRMCSGRMDVEPKKRDEDLSYFERLERDAWERQAEQQAWGERADQAVAKKVKSQAWVAVILFFVFRMVFTFPDCVMSIWLFLMITVTSVVFGYPVGLFLAHRGSGPLEGGTITGALSAFQTLVIALPLLMFGDAGIAGLTLAAMALSFGYGFIPGVYIGYHIELSNT